MDIAIQREIRKCFSLIIPAFPEEEMREAIRNTIIVDQATKAMINGEISPDELLEMCEPHLKDVDSYIEEVEENLVFILGD
jgi:hypothetical protein